MNKPLSETDNFLLEEWKVATENARHFNDLLMRLRTLGLPMVITIIGAGVALLGTGLELQLPRYVIDFAGIVFAVLVLLIFITSIIRKDWAKEHEFPVPLYGWERVAWGLVTLVFFGFFCAALIYDGFFFVGGLTDHKEYLAGVFVMLLGLVLLVALYSLDRFYYYKLLIGAIKRAGEIERQSNLSYHLTERTAESITQPNATRLITWFYWMPGFCTLMGSLILLLFH